MITVVGLGPAGPNEVTVGTMAAIEGHAVRFVRTSRHPSASVVGDAPSFDYLYDTLDTFDEVYESIVELLVAADREHGHVLYAVPGSPLVAEHTVERLIADGRVEVSLVPAMSFLDLTWVRLQVDPQRGGVRLVDGMAFAEEIVGERGPILVSQCHSKLVLSDIKCALIDPPSTVTVLQRLGLPDERIFELDWNDLDRSFEPDHLTSLWITELSPQLRNEMQRLVDTVGSLRELCPWDQQQTHLSLAPYVIEEAYELAEAIVKSESEDCQTAGESRALDHMIEELGDVLFQVVFHACLGNEDGRFSFEDVARGLSEKLIRRHPHVFGDVNVANADEVVAQWEVIKQAERNDSSANDPMAGLTEGLPALSYASKVLKRATAVGYFDLSSGDGSADHDQHTDEVSNLTSSIGQQLLHVVTAARSVGVDPELALRLTAARLRDDVRRSQQSV